MIESYQDIEEIKLLLNTFNIPIAIITADNNLIFKNIEFNNSYSNIDEIDDSFIINNQFIKKQYKNETFILYKNQYDKGFLHDLNNFFTGMLNIYALLKRNNNIEDNDPLNIKFYNSTKRILNFINNKLVTKNINYFQIFNIHSMLNDLISEFRLSTNNISVLYKNETEYIIKGNYDDLYRTILNFLINAKEAILSESGEIICSLYRKDSFLKIEIIDNGIGITESDLLNIFDINFSTKEKNRISGIGLFEARKIIEKHQGHINVETCQNKGTKFTISLPIEDLVSNNSYDILLVDDDEVITELLNDLIIEAGFTIIKCSNGLTAKYLYDNNKFRMLVIDKNIPTLSGIDLIRYIRVTNQTIPIILATGSQVEVDIQIDLKLDKVLTKPYLFDDLLKTINQFLFER